MLEVNYNASKLKGEIIIPPSKSMAHRALICAALSGEACKISNIDLSNDIIATTQALIAFGAKFDYNSNSREFTVTPFSEVANSCKADCIESGSTVRFMIPIAAALGINATFIGSGRLPERPLNIYEDLLPTHGVKCKTLGGLPFGISGKLEAGVYILPGNVSSQFISGLLFALPLLNGNSKITLSSPLESKSYVNLTVQMLKRFGIEITENETSWEILGNQKYRAVDYTVEGDWSQAAFFLAMAALNPSKDKIYIKGMDMNSAQGDKEAVNVFRKLGLTIENSDDVLTVYNPKFAESFAGLAGFEIDAAQIPDMVPAISVCAALAKGETRIYNAQRLRLKECDRLLAMQQAINALGGNVEITEDGLLIKGVEALIGGKANGENDHRVVMALSAAALRSKNSVVVTDAHSINKSYPSFFEDYIELGGVANVINVG